jgi:flagellar basal-body rod protein FlgF
MVNESFLPPPFHPRQSPKLSETFSFPNWHGIRSHLFEPHGLGEPDQFEKLKANASRLCGPDGEVDQSERGEPAMENSLLVGLSRQTTLERQLDAISNNIANVNTNGYKADHTLFEEYLTSGAHEDNFKGLDRRISYVQDRGSFRDFTQGAMQPTSNPLDVAIIGAGFLAVQTPTGERYTRDGNLQINNQGQLVTHDGYPVLGQSGPIVFQPTDHDISISGEGTITVLEGASRTDSIRGKLRAVSFADAQTMLKQGNNLFAAGDGGAQADLKSTFRQGYVEKSNVNAVIEMSRMIEVTHTYANLANLLQQQSDLHKTAINQLADVPA